MLYEAPPKHTTMVDNVTSSSSVGEYGTSITADATTAHVKGAFTQLISSVARPAYGVMIALGNVGTTASTNTRMLVDIALGPSSSEIVIIPNLIAGQAAASASSSGSPHNYFFPIHIPAGVRVSARCSTLALSDTCHVQIRLLENKIPGKWYGQRVTAYGANTANSTGTSHTHGNGNYATTTQLTAATDYNIRAMQLGIDLLTDTTGNTKRGHLRIAAGGSTNYIVIDIPYRESTTLEAMDFMEANFLLSHMGFNIPAGSYLGVGADMNAAGEARGFVIYGVD